MLYVNFTVTQGGQKIIASIQRKMRKKSKYNTKERIQYTREKNKKDNRITINTCVCVCVCVLSHVWLFVPPRTIACKAPLSMGIFQARILERVAMSYSRGFSHTRDQTQVSHIEGRFFTIWASRGIQEYWSG